ncbi:hypothetical protein [Adlercreutzia murintestinalis]|jgi:hypothetical protein|uniref:hypothetical protein n=1 Tax=Adlercreutzia murintestinalis TaxID=2941325 RepID=UPI00203ACD6C|nr:hypothetical protein [Adlercreutzia murintestinalis]
MQTQIAIPLAKNLNDTDIQSLESLAKDLSIMGITVKMPNPLSGGALIFEYDREAHKRNAGRKKKTIPTKSAISKMTQNQIDDWLLNNPIETIQTELGVGRSTAFRRRTEARERVEYAIIALEEGRISQP